MLDRARSPLPWLGALLALYLLAPIAAFVVRLGGGVSSAPGLGAALLTSLLTATISAAVIATLGVPLAYLLARGRGVATRLLFALVAFVIAGVFGATAVGLLNARNPFTAPSSASARAEAAIERATGAESSPGVLALVSAPPGSPAVTSAARVFTRSG